MSPITDVGLAIFGSLIDPVTGETFLVALEETTPVEFLAPTYEQWSSTCRFPTPADAFRLCMLRTGHAGSCLPAPADRGADTRDSKAAR
jgi:hypothetical protein